jgi:hypothetical protein
MKQILAAILFLAGLSGAAWAQSSVFPGSVQMATGSGTTSLGPNLTLNAPLNSTTQLLVCGFKVDYTGSGTIAPVSLGGLPGGTVYYEGTSLGQPPFVQNFQPCLPASAGSSITLGVTTDSGATKVSGFIWGLWE